MPDANLLNNRSLGEGMNAVRRILNDTDTDQPAIQDHMLREMYISEYVLVSHEAGWDARTPTRPTTGTSILSYSLAVGAYQTTLEGENDVVAVSDVYTDRSDFPLQFVARAILQKWVQNDLTRSGVVAQGIPRYWTMELLQSNVTATTAEMLNRLWVYPAASLVTVVYWPRTLVDTESVDPSSTTGRTFGSYHFTYALEHKVAALCCRAMDDTAAKRLGIDRQSLGEVLWNNYQQALERERGERAMHVLNNRVQELMA